MICVIQLRAGDEITRIRESRYRNACGVQTGVTTGVIEVQMSIDHDCDLSSRNAGARLQCLGKWMSTVDTVQRLMLRRPLIANSGFNQDLFRACIDENAVHVHANAVFIVGWTFPSPELARDHSEH